MGTRTRIAGLTRWGAVLVLAAGVGVLSQVSASAGVQVAPEPLGTVGDTAAGLLPAPPPADPPQPVTQVVGAAGRALGGTAASGSGPQSGTQSGSRPAQTGTGSGTGSSSHANPSARAGVEPAADDGTVVGADVTVRDLLGACVRLTGSGVPARSTVVVLDQNLFDQLTAVGLPVERLVVPCPVGAGVGTSGGSLGGAQAGTTSAAATGDPALAGNDGLLAFTGADLAPTLLLAGGLIALGIAFLRKAHALVDDRAHATQIA